MERQLTVNQVYKLTELRSFNQELENKEAHTGDDQDQQDTVQKKEEDHSPTTSTSNKKQKI